MEASVMPARDLQRELAAALESGDTNAIRSAAKALVEPLESGDSAAELLEHADRLNQLGMQTAELVHELRQPLLAVKGFAQLILERPTDTEFVRMTSETLVEQSRRMEVILDRVRDYARRERGPIGTGRTNVNDAVNAATELLKYQLKKLHVTVEIDLADGLPDVIADPVGLQQIFVNLIGNARDALDQSQGFIRIRTSLADGMVEAFVEDDGPGISDDVRDRLFQPFATGKKTGTGLGLAVSRGIAETVGGSLELVDSERGATFRLRLPIA